MMCRCRSPSDSRARMQLDDDIHYNNYLDVRHNDIPCSKNSIPPSSRRRSIAVMFNALSMLIFSLVIGTNDSANFTMGPEDHYFCGYKWDDPGCQSRQHCPTGRSEECEGSIDGVKCFANTNCDTRYGDGDFFVPGQAPKQSPGGSSRPTYSGMSENATDHYWCGISLDNAAEMCDTHCPSGTSSECPHGKICFFNVTACDARNLFPPTAAPKSSLNPAIADASIIPTEVPIGPPDPLPYPSEDPTDHWFCGIGIDDANANCEVHCPTAKECPLGQICYFGTECDHRTFSPSPPPTKRPTLPPTSAAPTVTATPTLTPTASTAPSSVPSETQPTRGPMTALQASFYCGFDWEDAITNCKMKCPSGESTECPSGEECFAQTPCTEEMGYPEEGGINGTSAEDGSSELCVPFEVTVTSDQWPKEISWRVIDTDLGEIVIEGTSDVLIPGEPVTYQECVNKRGGCYAFTINDAGGDGLCCKHGQGSYEVSWDGTVLKDGAAFYDSETTTFGLCGETEQPTESKNSNAPSSVQSSAGGNGKQGGSSFKCLPASLIDEGYEVSIDKCDLFESCFNQYINVGDDWFCKEDEQCISVPICGEGELPTTASPKAEATTSPSQATPFIQTNMPTMKIIPKRPTGSIPKPSGLQITPTNTVNDLPSISPSSTITTEPTTNHPTSGPCSGLKCNEDDHCRSQFGFCGPGATYCNENPIWTKDCVTSIPTVLTPTESPIDRIASTVQPSAQAFRKPAFSKPGGNGSISKPARTHSPITNYPTSQQETNPPTDMIDTAVDQSDNPTAAPSNLVTTISPVALPNTQSPSLLETEISSANEFDCSGEPCPVASHCRSRYGSCGPGFIYCNVHSIWKENCPPSEEMPTTSPTSIQFTIEPTSSSIQPNASTIERHIPTLIPLAKPTLTTIIDAVPFAVPISVDDANNGVNESDNNATIKGDDSGDKSDLGTITNDSGPLNDNYFQSSGFLAEWTSSNSAKYDSKKFTPSIEIIALLFLLTITFI